MLNVKFETHISTILFVVYVVVWMRNLVCYIQRKFRPRVTQNRAFNRTFGPKRDELGGVWRKLTIEELPNLIYLLFILPSGSCMIWHTDVLIKWTASKFSCWVLRNIQRRFETDKDLVIWLSVFCTLCTAVLARRRGLGFQKRNIPWKYLSDPSQRKF